MWNNLFLCGMMYVVFLYFKDYNVVKGGKMKKIWKNYKSTIILLVAIAIGAIVGIIFSAAIAAYLYASMEKYFYNEMFCGNNMISEKAILIIYVLIVLARRVTCSAGFFTIYVMLIFFIFNILLTVLCRYKQSN